MKKSKILLPIYLILSLAIIISAVVVSLTAGINLGIDFVGGKQIEIQVPDGESTTSYKQVIADVLDDYGLSIDTSFEEDKFTDKYYVVKINTQELSSDVANKIRTDISQELNIPVENVSEILTISGSVTQQTIINASVAVIGILVFLFVAGWLRLGVMNGLTLLFGTIHNMIITFAVILLSRIQLSVSACVSVFVLSVVFAGLAALLLDNAKELTSSKLNKDETTHVLYAQAFRHILLPVIIILASILVFAVATLFVGTSTIMMFAVASVISVITCFYSLHVSSLMGGYLAEVKQLKDKQKLSKNN